MRSVDLNEPMMKEDGRMTMQIRLVDFVTHDKKYVLVCMDFHWRQRTPRVYYVTPIGMYACCITTYTYWYYYRRLYSTVVLHLCYHLARHSYVLDFVTV